MKRKKIIALLLASAMVCSMLSGCGKEEGSTSSSATGESVADSKTQSQETSVSAEEGETEERELLPDGNTYATGLPIV